MIEKLTNYIVDCQIASGKIKEEEGSVYRYGYTLFFEKLINIAIALIICLITGKWLAVGLFLLAVIPFRSFAGGWHAKEFWQCAILSNLMIVIMLICIEKLCITKEIVYVIFEVITLLALIFIIPTQNPNKKLSQNELKKYKKVSFIIWLVQCCLLVVFFVYKSYQFSTIMLYTHIVIVIAAVAQTMSETKKQIDKEWNKIMFNVAICDDDKNFIQYVEDIIKELGYAEDVKFFEYLSGEEFLFDIDERGDLDLVVLDIQMGETDGKQVSVELRKRYKSTTLVFCSGYFKPSPENIKVSPFRFLLKEYSRDRMVSEFKEIFEYLMNNKDEPSIVCRGERSQVQVYANEIMYIEISKRGTKVHTLNKGGMVEKVYSCKKSLDFLYELFKESNFAYAHNSYIVNLKYVKKLCSEELKLVDGQVLSVSRTKIKNLRKQVTEYFERKYM